VDSRASATLYSGVCWCSLIYTKNLPSVGPPGSAEAMPPDYNHRSLGKKAIDRKKTNYEAEGDHVRRQRGELAWYDGISVQSLYFDAHHGDHAI
jgi:hypothetical protein